MVALSPRVCAGARDRTRLTACARPNRGPGRDARARGLFCTPSADLTPRPVSLLNDSCDDAAPIPNDHERYRPIEDDLYHLPGFYDPFSAISHLLGAVIFLILGVKLILRVRGDTPALVASIIYAFSGVMLLSMSGVFHMLPGGTTGRAVLQRLDHAAIFLLIAGTFTPIHVKLFVGWRRWAPLAFIWTCAVTGITLKSIFFEDFPEWLGLILYLAMGWFGAFSAWLIQRQYGVWILTSLFFGAIAYTLGALVELFAWPTLIPRVVRPHEVFHLFVMVGVYFHWVMAWEAAGIRARRRDARAASE